MRNTGKHSVLSLQLLVLLVAKITESVLVCPTLRVHEQPLKFTRDPRELIHSKVGKVQNSSFPSSIFYP